MLNQIVNICIENKIKYLTLFALSTENYKRSSINILFDVVESNYYVFYDQLLSSILRLVRL